jgi:hypothetical protein
MSDDGTEDDALFLADLTGTAPTKPPAPGPESKPTE